MSVIVKDPTAIYNVSYFRVKNYYCCQCSPPVCCYPRLPPCDPCFCCKPPPICIKLPPPPPPICPPWPPPHSGPLPDQNYYASTC
ncbi:hypothetical protein KPH14_012114 [Odynerus spinipes]|uniref:Uncharacterized protein n=1 Tax=Odynerus spinipes TaxID=1348599 RepID=A0AAD9RA91_9HYME|nr:hypothetical protein KPH14_012114 [Odynerus spinipes]